MNPLYQLLDRQEKLLKASGYDEKSLNSPDKPGLFMESLKYLAGYALKQSLNDDSPAEFKIRTVGFFNNDKSIVLFNFHYLFEFKQNNLQITRLDIASGKAITSIAVTNPQQLPHSSEALSILAQKQKGEIKRMANYRPVYMTKHSEGRQRSS